MGAFEGIKLAWEMGVKKIILKMICIEIVILLSDQTRDQNLLRRKVRSLLKQMEGFRVIHVSK